MKTKISKIIIVGFIILAFAFMAIASSSSSSSSSGDGDTNKSSDAETTEITDKSNESENTKNEDEEKNEDSDKSDDEKDSDDAKDGEESETSASETDKTLSKKEFIKSCGKIDYKKLARNPEKYIGKNYYFTCYVSSAREGGLFTGFQKYYITYSFSMKKAKKYVKKGWADSIPDAWLYASDTNKCVWLLDNRDENDPDYVKILENDVIKVYGTFTGLTDTQNALSGETGEQVSLDIKYVEILAE